MVSSPTHPSRIVGQITQRMQPSDESSGDGAVQATALSKLGFSSGLFSGTGLGRIDVDLTYPVFVSSEMRVVEYVPLYPARST